jgi:hypothetical protein
MKLSPAFIVGLPEGVVDVYLHAFSTSAVDAGELSSSSCGHLFPRDTFNEFRVVTCQFHRPTQVRIEHRVSSVSLVIGLEVGRPVFDSRQG